MAIAPTLERYLNERKVKYALVQHAPAMSATRTAQASHVAGDRLAKAVVVKHDDGFALAVVPATHHVRLAELSRLLDRRVGLADEREGSRLFGDCDTGAFPALGAAYGLEVVVDDALADLPEVYFEGGDHATLVQVDGAEFRKLMQDARHGRFSAHD